MRAAVAVAAALVLAGCSQTVPAERPSAPEPSGAVRVVNLNAAMGYRAGPGDPAGTDPTDADLRLLADDILHQRGDIANLQEMALPAAKDLQEILRQKSGDEWQMNWAHSVNATYHAGKDEDPAKDLVYENVSAGNAQLVRIGDRIAEQKPTTVDGEHDDQGIMLPSGARSFQGTEITTTGGDVLAVYNTHLALARQVGDAARAADVTAMQRTTESHAGPTVVTGDFNQAVDQATDQTAGSASSPLTVAAIQAFTGRYGYTDAAREKGPTIDGNRIDYILARGVTTTDVVRFASHESDHQGLAATVEVG